jgi:Xaa-Pro aminopeptidase
MINNRLSILQTKLLSFEGQALLITKPENRFYLSGFTGSSAFLVVTAEASFILTDFRYIQQAKEEALAYQVIDYDSDFTTNLKNILREEKIKTLLFEEDYITYSQYLSWQNDLRPIELKPAGNIVEQLRVVKDEQEIELLRKAADIAHHSFNNILSYIKPGVRESEVALELEYQMRKLGATGPSFEIIIASGYRSKLPHGVASEKTLEIGDLILFDFGAVYQGYHSDMSRTIVLGKANSEQKKIYGAVLEAQCKALDTVKAGMPCRDLDNVARKHLELYGYDRYFGHSLGHGVGLAIHENPRVSISSKEILLPGMAITIEPGVYINGVGGVRIEDLIIVTEEGYLNLTPTAKELLEIH